MSAGNASLKVCINILVLLLRLIILSYTKSRWNKKHYDEQFYNVYRIEKNSRQTTILHMSTLQYNTHNKLCKWTLLCTHTNYTYFSERVIISNVIYYNSTITVDKKYRGSWADTTLTSELYTSQYHVHKCITFKQLKSAKSHFTLAKLMSS